MSEVKKFNNRPKLETPIGDLDFKTKHYNNIQKMKNSNPITDYDIHFDKNFEKFCDRVNNFKITLRSVEKDYNFCNKIKNSFLKKIIARTFSEGDRVSFPNWYDTEIIPENDLFYSNIGPFPKLLKEIEEEIYKLQRGNLGGKRRRSTKRKTKRSKRKQKRNTKRRASHRRRR